LVASMTLALIFTSMFGLPIYFIPQKRKIGDISSSNGVYFSEAFNLTILLQALCPRFRK
jgi:hypothetical protein